MHFIMDGFKNGEKCLYVTLEESVSSLKEERI
ncbi:hypothetical protein [Thermococcus peptonophilus]